MADLIDRDALREVLAKRVPFAIVTTDDAAFAYSLDAAYAAVMEAPTVDAEPVRRGNYVDIGGEGVFMGVHRYECSECGGRYSLVFANMKYCSYCGSRMGGVGE